MTSIQRLTSVNFDTHWICFNEWGQLDVVEKDSRLVRFFKCALGRITCHDYYAHIRADCIIRAIIERGKGEGDAKVIDALLHLSGRFLNKKVALQNGSTPYSAYDRVQNSILEAHPEMVALPDANDSIYRLPKSQLTLIPTKQAEAVSKAADEVMAQVFGTTDRSSVRGDDPRFPLYHLLMKPHLARYAPDGKGNYWIETKVHWQLKVLMPVKNLTPYQGRWWKAQIPKQEVAAQNPSHPPFSIREQIVFIKETGALKMNQQRQIEVMLEDHEGIVQADGSVILPNGRELDAKMLGKTYTSSLCISSLLSYNLTLVL